MLKLYCNEGLRRRGKRVKIDVLKVPFCLFIEYSNSLKCRYMRQNRKYTVSRVDIRSGIPRVKISDGSIESNRGGE